MKIHMRNFGVRLLLGAVLLVSVAPLPAQRPFSGTPEVEQSLHKLNELGTVLMIAAHPDDERTAVLAYFARGRHMRTAYLSLTRGEGGQNLIGSEQGAQLGIIRTQELLAARQIDGAEQFFTRAIDFGFTQDRRRDAAEMGPRPHPVRHRLGDPPLPAGRRSSCASAARRADGHGQHQVSAILGKEAFDAAGDPRRFPEQLQYVQPWQAKRLVRANVGFTGLRVAGSRRARRPSDCRRLSRRYHAAGHGRNRRVQPGAGLFLRGTGRHEPQHAPQPGHGRHARGPAPAHADFGLVAGAPVAEDLFEGIDTTWNRLPGGAAVGAILDEAIRAFEPEHPEKSLPALAKARPLIAAIDDPLAKVKLAELDEAIALCAGLWVEAQARAAGCEPGRDAGRDHHGDRSLPAPVSRSRARASRACGTSRSR